MIYGVATNDLPDHKTQIVEYYKDENGKTKRKVIWSCPFYTKWFNMISRCYNPYEHARHPLYEKAFVCEEWLYFSKFKTWMGTQDFEGKQLDKDILFKGNQEYSPDKCVFVSQKVNKFLLEKTAYRDLPIGVSYHKTKEKYIATISCGEHSNLKHLGGFDNPFIAHLKWAEQKFLFAKEIAESQDDERIAKALVLRYNDILENANRLYGEYLSGKEMV